MSIAAIGLIIIQIVFREKLTEWGFGMSEKMKEIDEDNPFFFNAIKLT
jgi:fumarylacetoacetate (FAA) hydrolase family protein